MKIIIHSDIRIQEMISIAELSMRFICMQNIIIITGIQMAIHEFSKNLHLIIACLRSPHSVNPKFEIDKLMLFITASHAE
jgi:hypothetical protein